MTSTLESVPHQFWDRIFNQSQSYELPLYFWEKNQFVEYSRAQITENARRVAGFLDSIAVKKNDVAALVLDNSVEAVSALLGCWWAGVTVASLPEKAIGSDRENYRHQLREIDAQLSPKIILCATDTAHVLSPSEAKDRLNVEDFQTALAGAHDNRAPAAVFLDEKQIAFIQYSSGSTGVPKGCALTVEAICNQMEMLFTKCLNIQAGETGVNWAPFSHDMGFFGGLMGGLWNDCAVYHSTPDRFRLSPRSWLEDLASFQAAYTSASPTALQVAAKVMRLRKRGLPGSLESLRCLLLGAERISWDVIDDAMECLAPHGMRMSALMPAYGLAEATLGVASIPLNESPRYISVNSLALADGRVEVVPDDHKDASKVVSCGYPIYGVELDVSGEDGYLHPIRFRSISAAKQYYNREELSRERFRGGYVDTGDLGFMKDGELYPVGRSDDLISRGGRNIYVSALEAEVEASIDEFRNGCTALVDATPDQPQPTLAFIAEVGGKPDLDHISDAVGKICRDHAAIALDMVVFIPRRSLPRTPSGKIQRHRCRHLVSEAELARPDSVARFVRLKELQSDPKNVTEGGPTT